MKKWWIVIAIVVLVLGWYLISPAFQVIEVQEASPVKDAMEAMDAGTRAEFDRQVEAMKDQVLVVDDAMPSAKVVAEGNFKPRAHEVEGRALLISNGRNILRFEDFETINGPELRIYLSPELGDDDIIDLGKIKATKGSVNYEIPEGVDLDKYNKVLVWCKPFRVLFSYAELT